MANVTIEFFSGALCRRVTFRMYLPNDIQPDEAAARSPYAKRPMKTLFLLHGYTGSAESWGMEELAKQYRVALVMPNGENGFWLDGASTGHRYATFVGAELVDYLRSTFGLAKTAEDTAICGLSMGGFGALHTGFAYPNRFGKVGAMSSALIVHEIAGMREGEENGIANYAYYRECFGDLETVEESDSNPEVLVRRLKEQGGRIPEIYLCCGTEDFLLENNRAFHRFLESISVEHRYTESKGAHDWGFWGEYSGKILRWMFGSGEPET